MQVPCLDVVTPFQIVSPVYASTPANSGSDSLEASHSSLRKIQIRFVTLMNLNFKGLISVLKERLKKLDFFLIAKTLLRPMFLSLVSVQKN